MHFIVTHGIQLSQFVFERLHYYATLKNEGHSQIKGVKELAPDTKRMDFESATTNSATEAFPNTEVVRFLQFCQSLYRKVIDLGISVKFREDKNFSLSIRLFAAFKHTDSRSKYSNYRCQILKLGLC